jgi:hypothetical protein
LLLPGIRVVEAKMLTIEERREALMQESAVVWEGLIEVLGPRLLAAKKNIGPDLVVLFHPPPLQREGMEAFVISERAFMKDGAKVGDETLYSRSATETLNDGKEYVWAFFYGLPSALPGKAFGCAMPMPIAVDTAVN